MCQFKIIPVRRLELVPFSELEERDYEISLSPNDPKVSDDIMPAVRLSIVVEVKKFSVDSVTGESTDRVRKAQM